MDLSKTLLHLEQRLLSQDTRRDAEEISRLLADDFIEFGASGGTWTKTDLIEQLPCQPFTERIVSEFTIRQLSEHNALVTYHCHTVAINQHSHADSLRSSIWRKQGEQWQLVFHQGTFIPSR